MLDITAGDIFVGMGVVGILMFLGFAFHGVINRARTSLFLEDIAMYQTHISRLEGQRYTALPVVRQLGNVIDDSDAGIRAYELLESLEKLILTPTHYKSPEGYVLIPDLAMLDELADTWQRQASEYSDDDQGNWTSTAISRCADALRAVLHDDKLFIAMATTLASINRKAR